MYICICNAIRDRDLREAARAVDGDVESVYLSLGCTPQCGQCLPEAEALIADARMEKNCPACLPA